MSRTLTREEQKMFTNKIGVREQPVFIDPQDGQEVVINRGSVVPKKLTKAGRRMTKKSKRRVKRRSLLKSRKVR